MRRIFFLRSTPGFSFILLVLHTLLYSQQLNGQTIIKLLAPQAALLSVEMPSGIQADDHSAIRLADSINITGGTPPYLMSWFDGNVLLSQSPAFEIFPDEIPANYRLIITDSKNCREEKNLTIGVGFEEEMFIPVRIYPVPASSFFVIDPGEFAGEIVMSVYNIEGRKIRELKFFEKKTFDIDFPAGTYLLELKTGTKRSVRKIIVSR